MRTLLLNLLRQTLSLRKRNVQISAELEEGKPLEQVLHESIENDVELNLDSQWWLEKLFLKHKLSFVQGVFIIYLVKVIPAILLLPWLVGRVDVDFLKAYISSFFGDMFIPVSLILIHSLYKSQVNLKKNMDENLKKNQFVAPLAVLTEKEMKSAAELGKLDKKYSNMYIKPVMLKTLQSGLKMTFNKSYQLGSGMISAGMYLFLMFLGLVVKALPESMTKMTDFGSPVINAVSTGQTLYGIAIDWFIIGLLAWTLFTTYLCVIQASGNPMKTRPFEIMKERFSVVSTLIFKTSLTVTFVVAWASPFVLLWSILPPDPVARQFALNFAESVLIIMIPVIVLSFLVPILKVHKSLAKTRNRLLHLKGFQLEAIKEFRESRPNKYMKVQKHLISDYKDIQRNSTWLFDLRQVLQLTGSVLLPLVTFWLSILLR